MCINLSNLYSSLSKSYCLKVNFLIVFSFNIYVSTLKCLNISQYYFEIFDCDDIELNPNNDLYCKVKINASSFK